MILERLFKLKIPAILISGLILFLGLLALAVGVYKTYEAVLFIFQIKEGKPGVTLIEALDIYLVALVILILGGGIFKLFVGNEDTFKEIPVLANIRSFIELKILLWETLLLMLTIWATLDFAITEPAELHFEYLILPGSVLILAAALRLVKGHQKPKDSEGGD
jgi:uncharacterized membrane protein YqhA